LLDNFAYKIYSYIIAWNLSSIYPRYSSASPVYYYYY